MRKRGWRIKKIGENARKEQRNRKEGEDTMISVENIRKKS